MFNSSLLEILKAMSPKEFKDFGDFVCSPFYNKNEGVIKLYNYMKKYYPDFNEENTKKEKVYRSIFLGADYNDVFMRSIMFKLNSLAEDFITISDFTNNTASYSIRQIDSLLDRNLDATAQKLIKQTAAKFSASKNNNGEHYYGLFELEKLKHIIYSRTYTPLTVKDKPNENLLSESDYLIKFFLIRILQRYRYLLNKTKSVNTLFEHDFLNEILDYLSNNGKKFLQVDLIDILHKQVLLLLDPGNEQFFHCLSEKLTDDNSVLDPGERNDGIAVLNNYCIDRLYEGKDEYRDYLHRFHKYGLSKNQYSRVKGGYFEPSFFNNIVTVGLMLNEDEWTLNFIEKYYTKLQPDLRESTYNLTHAKYYFSKKNLDKALKYLSKADFKDIYQKFQGRSMLIQIHYEMGNFETFFSLIESYRKFIANDKLLTDQHKLTNSNFIRFVSALGRIKSGAANDDPSFIKKQISECETLTYRKWLINKADELMVLKK